MSKMQPRKRIARVAHDRQKSGIIAWAKQHKAALSDHQFCGTATTGSRASKATALNAHLPKCGPLAGDQLLGAMKVFWRCQTAGRQSRQPSKPSKELNSGSCTSSGIHWPNTYRMKPPYMAARPKCETSQDRGRGNVLG